MKKLGTLEEIKDLRTVWTYEANDFTPWLSNEDNISILSDAVGIDISVDDTESPVGDFNVDIYATETGTDRKIIIENQLEDTNHDHLGKLITYASGKSANIIIWVVRHARDEHKAAIEWLNSHTDDSVGFFLCEIKLYKIGNSEPAVKFDVVERPNDWAKSIKGNDSTNPTRQLRLEYWTAFNDYVSNRTDFTKAFNLRKPSGDHWYSIYMGSSECHVSLSIIQKTNEAIAELYISDSKELYATLHSCKREIEKASGIKFDWRELPDRKASRIVASINGSLTDRDKWKEQFEWYADTAIKIKNVFRKYIKE